MKKFTLIFIPLLVVSTITACNNKKQNNNVPELKNYAIYHDDEFGGAYIKIGAEDFNALGFKYGDSIDISFTTNNTSWTDVGYYNGYYVPAGQELLVAYPGYEHIKFCINYGDDIYADNNFSENTKVTITLNQAGKYKDIQDTLSIAYSDDINTYPSREAFANFREMKGGNLKEGILYRGASPVDNSRSRTTTVDALLQENNIAYILDLADKNTTGTKYTVHEYFQGLMDANKVTFLGMAAAYKKDDFSAKMKTLFEAILANDGPYYIHCLEGKDRTGYVCMVIEALCGASYDELVEDYFITYKNYYGIEKGSSKYEAIKSLHIDEMIRYVFSFSETDNVRLLGAAPYYTKANNYLKEAVGLTQDQIDALQAKLSNQIK